MIDTMFNIGAEAKSSIQDASLVAALNLAARAALDALEASRPEERALLQTLDAFVMKVNLSHVDVPHGSFEGMREVVHSFRTKYDALRSTLDRSFGRAAMELSDAFADLERDAAFVTLMLFGRTRTGKSTTMEALTGGDGASIGKGRQHTTTEIQSYYFPRPLNGGKPSTPALRIVDTPGIEGFEGDALAEMAERFIERSDHILFMLTDAMATADELERFSAIKTHGKGVTVLLNVKAADTDLDLLMANPALIFKENEIEGHRRRITGYLDNRFDITPPHVIPIHARAAWLSTSATELPEGVHDRSVLRKHSRISDLEKWIADFIKQEARLARLSAPRDLLLGYIIQLKNELRPVAGQFRQVMGNMDMVSRRFREGTERARSRVARRFPLLRARFQAASDAVPGMLDEVIAMGGRGTDLDVRWRALLQRHGVTDAVQWFVAAGQQDFREQVELEVLDVAFEYEFSMPDGLDEKLGRYHEAEDGERINRYARAGMRVGGGTGASLLAGWAVLNFWNPTGWAALAAAAGVVVVGIAGEELARKATNEWERSSKKSMYEKRGEIIGKLRDALWADYRTVRGRCDEWIEKAREMQTQVVEEIARPVRESSRRLWQAAVETLGQLDEIADRVNEGLVHDLFAAVVPECERGAIRVTAVLRDIGRRTKVMVSSAGSGVNAFAACIGRQGSRIRRIRETLGDRRIDLVDAEDHLEMKVIQALGLRGPEAATVSISGFEGQTTAHVRANSQKISQAAFGSGSLNVRLASKLIGVNIVIMEA